METRVAGSASEPEVFGWSGNRMPNNTGSRSRFFFVRLQMSNVEMVQFLLKRLLKERFLAVHHDSH